MRRRRKTSCLRSRRSRYDLDVVDDAGRDPGRAAAAWAAIGAITPALDRLFVIKKRDIQPALDYNETSMKVDARLITTITIGRSLALALHAGVRFLKILNQRKKAV